MSSLFYSTFTRGQAGARRDIEIPITQVCTLAILDKKINEETLASTELVSSALVMIYPTPIHVVMIINNVTQCPLPFSNKTGLNTLVKTKVYGINLESELKNNINL